MLDELKDTLNVFDSHEVCQRFELCSATSGSGCDITPATDFPIVVLIARVPPDHI